MYQCKECKLAFLPDDFVIGAGMCVECNNREHEEQWDQKIPRIHYVLGFYFNESMTNVTLIKKNKPEWQKGKLNGLSGKIESGERPIDAMIREFKEEAGVEVTEWKELGTMGGDDWHVDIFYCAEKSYDKYYLVKSMEEEKLYQVPTCSIMEYNTISNIPWLICMCMDKELNKNSNYQVSVNI